MPRAKPNAGRVCIVGQKTKSCEQKIASRKKSWNHGNRVPRQKRKLKKRPVNKKINVTSNLAVDFVPLFTISFIFRAQASKSDHKQEINFTINFTVNFGPHARKISQIVKLIPHSEMNICYSFINCNQLYDLLHFACVRPKNDRKVDRKVGFLAYKSQDRF